jgi:hypothetical protein
MNRGAVFNELTRRNALRKAAKLSLLDLRTEFALAVEREAQRVYAEWCEKYEDDRKRTREDVLRELRVTRGADFPMSMGGGLLVGLMSDRQFRAFLEIEHGIGAPTLNSRHFISYGELRKSTTDDALS